MWNGKKKAITFSYDDGVTQDKRLVSLFNKYGLRASFNINSALLSKPGELIRDGVRVSHNKIDPGELRELYSGHEVAAHTLTHPALPELSDGEIVRQVEEDRLRLSELVGYEVIGLAYPGGGVNHDERTVQIVRERTGIKYARTIISTGGFDLCDDLFRVKPTAYHHEDIEALFRLAEDFLDGDGTEPKLFYIWGHSYEFDIHDDWGRFEEFCEMISRRDDVFYGTNKEVFFPEEALKKGD